MSYYTKDVKTCVIQFGFAEGYVKICSVQHTKNKSRFPRMHSDMLKVLSLSPNNTFYHQSISRSRHRKVDERWNNFPGDERSS